MSSEEAEKGNFLVEATDDPKSTEPAPAVETKKRPRLDVSEPAGGRDRKRGKSMFGILVGTLNKAKIEDKERSASEAAKKRQLIEQRLQAKLKKETDSVRRAEEAKKDKTTANRKEEDLQLQDSVYKLRRTHLQLLSNFLLTSDVIPTDNSTPPPPPPANPLAPPSRSHPPPLFFLPAVLTPAQEAFLSRRKTEVSEAAEREWNLFVEEKKTGIDEIQKLRQRVADEESKRKKSDPSETADMEIDGGHRNDASGDNAREGEMELDDGAASKDESKTSLPQVEEKKEEATTMHADDDEAVEY